MSLSVAFLGDNEKKSAPLPRKTSKYRPENAGIKPIWLLANHRFPPAHFKKGETSATARLVSSVIVYIDIKASIDNFAGQFIEDVVDISKIFDLVAAAFSYRKSVV